MTATARIIMISDARIGTDEAGAPAAADASMERDAWRRGLSQEVPVVKYYLRVDPAPGSAHLPINAPIAPLPYYVGLRELASALPHLVRSINRAVAEADIVVTRVPGAIGSLAVVLASIRRRRLAVEVVGDVRESLAGSGEEGFVTRLFAVLASAFTKILVKRAHALRYVTERTLQISYPPRPGATVVNFSSVRLGDWVGIESSAPKATPSVIAVGSQEQLYKGHDLLIRAHALVLRDYPDSELHLVGAGRVQQELRTLVEQLGIARNVVFHGYISDVHELVKLVDRAWIFAMPSRTEGLPRALIEAMARGKACIGTRIGGIPELLPPEHLIPTNNVDALADQIRRFYASPALRTQAGIDNEARAARFAPEALDAASQRWSSAVMNLQSQEHR